MAERRGNLEGAPRVAFSIWSAGCRAVTGVCFVALPSLEPVTGGAAVYLIDNTD